MVVHIFQTGPNGPDQTKGIKFGPLDRTRYLYSKLMRIYSLAINDLRKFRHLNLINLQMDTDTRTGATSSYKEIFLIKKRLN